MNMSQPNRILESTPIAGNEPDIEQQIVDVVYVDDDPLFCQIVSRELDKTTLSYRCFEDVAEALVFLESHDTRTLISDYRMPEMDGIQFLRGAQQLGNNVSTFIASAAGLHKDIEREVRDLNAQILLKDRFLESGFLRDLCTNPAQ